MSSNPVKQDWPRMEAGQLQAIDCPYDEPAVLQKNSEPRKVNTLTLIDGKTFLSTTHAGDLAPAGAPDIGFFHEDTRFLSHLELRLGGHRAVVLSSSTEKAFSSQIELTTGAITLRDNFDLPENTVHLRRDQLLRGAKFFDRITFENFNLSPVAVTVELEYGADFVDVFQVRGVARGKRGQFFEPVTTRDETTFYYRGIDDLLRHTHVTFLPAPDMLSGRCARWELKLRPLERIQLQIQVEAGIGNEPEVEVKEDFDDALNNRRRNFAEWNDASTHFESSDAVFNASLRTSTEDFHALQIPEGNEHIIAAGIPWFATMFGRDSIIAAFQTLMLNPHLAEETLRVLARYQGAQVNDWLDEEPGKILHEYRVGEMTNSGEMPFSPYYGSIDATPLFLILLSETYHWTANEKLVRDLLPNVYRALEWLDRYADLDGDGFIEYKRRSKRGLANQGWKDSWDANMHEDGTVAQPPIALVEVQGYVYDAKYRMARLLRTFGDTRHADKLKREAAELARKIEKSFWLKGKQYFAMALDAEKKPLEVISSNVGHLLFTRAVKADRARAVVHRLMQPDMHSGWGWRTLSAKEKVFNPLSYHRGSVWPHDNSLIAHGMAFYEFRRPAMHTLNTLYQAAVNFRDYRLPELFCGVQRRDSDVPVQYPVSCSPQAWASGALVLMLTSILGIRPSAEKNELNIVNPVLPDFLSWLHLRNLRVGKSRVSLDFARSDRRTFCNVTSIEGEPLLVNVAYRK